LLKVLDVAQGGQVYAEASPSMKRLIQLCMLLYGCGLTEAEREGNNDIQHNDTQHKDTQHKDTQHIF